MKTLTTLEAACAYDQLMDLITRIEWSGRVYDGAHWVLACPECGGARAVGHRKRCNLAAHLDGEGL